MEDCTALCRSNPSVNTGSVVQYHVPQSLLASAIPGTRPQSQTSPEPLREHSTTSSNAAVLQPATVAALLSTLDSSLQNVEPGPGRERLALLREALQKPDPAFLLLSQIHAMAPSRLQGDPAALSLGTIATLERLVPSNASLDRSLHDWLGDFPFRTTDINRPKPGSWYAKHVPEVVAVLHRLTSSLDHLRKHCAALRAPPVVCDMLDLQIPLLQTAFFKSIARELTQDEESLFRLEKFHREDQLASSHGRLMQDDQKQRVYQVLQSIVDPTAGRKPPYENQILRLPIWHAQHTHSASCSHTVVSQTQLRAQNTPMLPEQPGSHRSIISNLPELLSAQHPTPCYIYGAIHQPNKKRLFGETVGSGDYGSKDVSGLPLPRGDSLSEQQSILLGESSLNPGSSQRQYLRLQNVRMSPLLISPSEQPNRQEAMRKSNPPVSMSAQRRLGQHSDGAASNGLQSYFHNRNGSHTGFEGYQHHRPSSEKDLPRRQRSATLVQRGEPPTNKDGKLICSFVPPCEGQAFNRKCEWK